MEHDSLIPGVRDFYLLLILPIAAYWISASIFHLLDCRRWFQKYKIHSYEAGQQRNKATLCQVFYQVLAQQAIQVMFALFLDQALSSANPSVSKQNSTLGNVTWTQSFADDPGLNTGSTKMLASTTVPALRKGVELTLRFVIAILIADFWQYAWHRAFHSNRFLYKYVHSVHHRLYVPYSFGALYSSLAEAFIVDTIGTTVTFYLSGLSVLPATWFASLSIIKSVNDHSGYRFPHNPFDYLSANTTDFHDVHHQSWGLKYNYSQIYLTIWDDLLGTTMPADEAAVRRKRAQGNQEDAVAKKSE
ncbi:hypothetical protein AC578_8437 [Pseudocercospora eumusae]|uniref:Fatty acid hydroxylase domain-containing protein n=1 Tax=Pseudocercospora eumusae TaxID=321146 RepID=A0A139HS21_9PEZI|nr:hypothetical protein AC578_8437 [Pseudocercospora eumusae]